MLKESSQLWKYVTSFIKYNKVTSIFEVCSDNSASLRKLVPDYTAVSFNSGTGKMRVDFTTMGMASFNKRPYDLFLAVSVIERCSNYENFITQMRKLLFKHGIVSFLNGLDRYKDEFIQTPLDGKMAWNNKYSQRNVSRCLNIYGYRGDCKVFVPSEGNTVLLIRRDL